MTHQAPIPETAGDSDPLELLSFQVGGQDYCVAITAVREIRSATRATPLPHSPPYMRGVINLRGTVLPIMDLAIRLGLDHDGDMPREVIIVVASDERTIGLAVDAVSDILAVPASSMQPPPDLAPGRDPAAVSALTIVGEQMIRLLDLASVLPPSGEEVA